MKTTTTFDDIAFEEYQRVNSFHSEFKFFLKHYLLPLLGVSSQAKLTSCASTQSGPLKKSVYFGDDNRTLYFSDSKSLHFKLTYHQKLDFQDEQTEIENISLNVVQAFCNLSKFSYNNNSVQFRSGHLYSSAVTINAIYQMAVQQGICYWILGSKNSNAEKLISCLERWSVKTYEGRKVTFGFVINRESNANSTLTQGDWLKFMESDYAAVFSDSIHSLIELDQNCNFSRFLSLTEGGSVETYELSYNLPIRFAQCIQKYVRGENVGIFLLHNGDIIVSKKGQIRFIKRNLRWLNFSCAAFLSAASTFTKKSPEADDLLKEIYATMLDVSLAHTGGIIAVVNDLDGLRSMRDENPDSRILNQYDDLLGELTDSVLPAPKTRSKATTKRSESRTMRESDLYLKRSIIKALIGNTRFQVLDRKLRCELTAMDGACILTTAGEIVSFGAIIRNKSGSAGGGRSAACEELSKYGLAIKISTDGYVELYINGEICYSIK